MKAKIQEILNLIKENFPTTRELIAKQFMLSESTVNRAIKELKDNGFIGEKDVAKTYSWRRY